MKMSYFEDTDTLYIEFRQHPSAQSKNLDENTVLDIDTEGNVISITLEQASSRTDVNQLVLSGIAAAA